MQALVVTLYTTFTFETNKFQFVKATFTVNSGMRKSYMEDMKAGILNTVVVGRVRWQRKEKNAILSSALEYSNTDELEVPIIQQY